MIPEPLPRLESILRTLPAIATPRVLNVGCGAFPSALSLRKVFPDWQIFGLDLDRQALRQAHDSDSGLYLVQADMRDLPQVMHARFGLVLVRHPDLFRHPQAWEAVIPRLPAMLAPGGVLLITLYSPHEAAMLTGYKLPAPDPLREASLVSVDLVGRDRYVCLYHANSTH